MGSQNRMPHKLVSWLFISFELLIIMKVYAEPVEDTESNSFGRIIYDQRQSGKYNIHVSIKDVAIIEMDQNEIQDESFGDEDYYYDENDLTVKPIKFPTTTTLISSTAATTQNATEKPITTAASSPSINTYSPNSLAEIPTTATANNNESTKPSTSEATTQNTQNKTNLFTTAITTEPSYAVTARSKNNNNMKILAEPPQLLYRTPQNRIPNQQDQLHNDDSRIYKLKVRRTFKDDNKRPDSLRYLALVNPHRCRSNQYRDVSGNCRNKRSSSILRKLFGMIVSIPFANERHHDAE